MSALVDIALVWHAAGYAPLPIKPDGSKSPAVKWTNYTTQQPTEAEVRRWFTSTDTDGLGLVCGAASGGLEMLEVEGRAIALATELRELMSDNGFGELWARINSGYVEGTPSGGLHWYYRVEGEARRNTKLARRPATADELAEKPGEKIKVLIETRGQGGFTVIAPSAGRTHPTGGAWTTFLGSHTTIPTITVEERDAVHAVASLLDAMPAVDAPAPSAGQPRDPNKVRPGDDYNQRATWDEILTPRGWTKGKPLGRDAYGWTRPGKELRDGISATTNTRNGADRLYVFSTSTEFESEKPYTKFAAYTLLEHGGDYSAAAKALASEGYGEEPHRTVTSFEDIIGTTGNLATVHPIEPKQAPQLASVPERTLSHSDDANALALIDDYGHLLRHCSDRGRWYAWDGHVWQECPRSTGVAREYAKRVARALPESDKAEIAHKKRTLSAVGISAMLTQAATDNRITVTYDELDAHPWELNTPSGIVDLRTGNLMPADPAKLHTRSTTASPDPDADPGPWLAFLLDTFNGDQSLIAYLQRLVGYSAVGIVGPHILPFCVGSGGNGKGVFLEAVGKVLGGYATTAPAGFLMAKTHSSHETEIARLSGARMVLCSEVNEEDHFDEAKVKQLTGGDTLTARFMHQDHFTFSPTHQLWLMGNYRPTVKSGGRSFWRRLRLIPFTKEVPPEKIVDDLQNILATEHGPALLNWIIEGAVAYHRDGLQEPESVKAATAEYAHDQDTVTRFLEEACMIGGPHSILVKVSTVRDAYERWCTEAGEQPVTAKAFGIALGRAGVPSTRSKSARFYQGITLLETEENASSDSSETKEWFR